jgi:hypothetical protein
VLKVVSSIGGGVPGAVNYKGTWDATTNTPSLASGVGTQGDYYVVNVAGSTNLDGITDWQIGDWAIFNGTAWEKVDNTDSVSSVNGQVGTVVLDAADVGAASSNVNVIAGTGLGGGGNLEANVTVFMANTSVTAGTYGGNTNVSVVTIDAQGRITSASNVAIDGAATLPDPLVVNNLEAANVTVTANLFANLVSSASAAMPDPSLPLNPEGYVSIVINGATKKVPFYGV